MHGHCEAHQRLSMLRQIGLIRVQSERGGLKLQAGVVCNMVLHFMLFCKKKKTCTWVKAMESAEIFNVISSAHESQVFFLLLLK